MKKAQDLLSLVLFAFCSFFILKRWLSNNSEYISILYVNVKCLYFAIDFSSLVNKGHFLLSQILLFL